MTTTPVPARQPLKEAIVATLEAAAPLVAAIAGGHVYNGLVPAYVDGDEYDWTLPALTYTWLSDIDSHANTYCSLGIDAELALIAHDRGAVPGALSFARCNAILALAEDALAAIPVTIGTSTTLYFRRLRGLPESVLEDGSEFIHVQTGAVYTWWIT